MIASREVISVDKLVKRYTGAKSNAVDGVSFSVNKGEFYSLLGPNGAGKTTTISILTTSLLQTEGKVSVAGYDNNKNPERIRKKIGVIFQQPSLDLNLTAEENMRLHVNLYNIYPFRPLYSMMPKNYKERLNELAKILEMDKEIHSAVKTFSGGMKRKMEIVRSLMHNPEILFLDEPTSGLDPKSRRDLWHYIDSVRQEKGTTVLLTTHYLDEAEGADTVTVINRGKVIASGSPASLKHAMIKNYISIGPKEGDTQKLESELDEKNIVYHKKDNRYILEIEEDKMHKILKAITTDIVKIDIHTPTLEEAYLEIISKDLNHGD